MIMSVRDLFGDQGLNIHLRVKDGEGRLHNRDGLIEYHFREHRTLRVL